MKKRRFIIILIVITVVLGGVGGFFAYKYIDAMNRNESYQAEQLVTRLEHWVDLPSDKPTVATIVDRERLSNSLLRERAENGDKLIIYADARKIILYRPSSDKIIEMLTIEDEAASLSP